MSVCVKVTYKKECRRFFVDSFGDLQHSIRDLMSVSPETVRLQYCDDDGDVVTLSTPQEFRAAAQSVRRQLCFVAVDLAEPALSVNRPLPAPHTPHHHAVSEVTLNQTNHIFRLPRTAPLAQHSPKVLPIDAKYPELTLRVLVASFGTTDSPHGEYLCEVALPVEKSGLLGVFHIVEDGVVQQVVRCVGGRPKKRRTSISSASVSSRAYDGSSATESSTSTSCTSSTSTSSSSSCSSTDAPRRRPAGPRIKNRRARRRRRLQAAPRPFQGRRAVETDSSGSSSSSSDSESEEGGDGEDEDEEEEGLSSERRCSTPQSGGSRGGRLSVVLGVPVEGSG